MQSYILCYVLIATSIYTHKRAGEKDGITRCEPTHLQIFFMEIWKVGEMRSHDSQIQGNSILRLNFIPISLIAWSFSSGRGKNNLKCWLLQKVEKSPTQDNAAENNLENLIYLK